MNFAYMPELKWRYGYLSVIIVSLVIAIGEIIYFKKKNSFNQEVFLWTKQGKARNRF